jgi:hypothetical protein
MIYDDGGKLKLKEGVCMKRQKGMTREAAGFRPRSLALTVSALLFLWGAAACAVEPLLTTQPVYGGTRFYVYRPQGLPPNWYTTYDSYPVWKNNDGIWYYGIYDGATLVPTSYAVGSVIPSSVGITPYVAGRGVYRVPLQEAPPAGAPIYAAPVMSAPASGPAFAPSPNPVPAAVAPVYVEAPEWMWDPQFMMLGMWKENVDRVGILRKPAVPVAWKGDLPQVIYAWTGASWHQMVPRDGQRPGDVLKNQLYSLTRLANRKGETWGEPEVAFLAQQATAWGFAWIGELNVLPEEY